MKGVILAGGSGTRLRPMTRVVNKHVIPIYDQPMIFYPVRTLLRAGIDELLVISNADHIGKYIELLEEADIDAEFSYKVQSEPLGIAHGVGLAEDFVDGPFAVILGDNIVLDDLSEEMATFPDSDAEAKIFLTRVSEPSAYGVATIDNGRITKIEEKPSSPDSNYAVIGLYLYKPGVFERIADLEPSDRGELEITDVNDQYVQEGRSEYGLVEGEWFDAGTPEGVFRASRAVRNQSR